MTSLKAFIANLAPVIGTTSTALYERQRALVRCGLLEADSGRGPGSGVKASGQNIARLLIAHAAVNSLSEVDGRLAAFFNAKPTNGQCSLTGGKTFVEALAALFEQRGTVGALNYIEIEQNGGGITIDFTKGGKHHRSVFHHGRAPRGAVSGVMKLASIYPNVIAQIHALLSGSKT